MVAVLKGAQHADAVLAVVRVLVTQQPQDALLQGGCLGHGLIGADDLQRVVYVCAGVRFGGGGWFKLNSGDPGQSLRGGGLEQRYNFALGLLSLSVISRLLR